MKRHHIGTTHGPKLLQEFRTTLLGKLATSRCCGEKRNIRLRLYDHCGHSFVRLSLSKIETLILTRGNPWNYKRWSRMFVSALSCQLCIVSMWICRRMYIHMHMHMASLFLYFFACLSLFAQLALCRSRICILLSHRAGFPHPFHLFFNLLFVSLDFTLFATSVTSPFVIGWI